jgi:hypothetical protein
MKVRRWLLDKSCAALLFLFRMLGARARMHLNISRGDGK